MGSRLVSPIAVLALAVLTIAGPIVNAEAGELPPGGTFVDDNGSSQEPFIEAVYSEGITRGCNPPTNNRYCPDRGLTRAEMATMLVRALELPASAADPFNDDEGSIHHSSINALAATGITQGCNPPTNDRYCPGQSITRGQMAAFLARALGLRERLGNPFIDDDSSIFQADIERLAAAGVTKGCNPPDNTNYCPPSDPV